MSLDIGKKLGVLNPKNRMGPSANNEIKRLSKVTLYSLTAIVVICVIMSLILHVFGGGIGPWSMHVSNAMDNIIAAGIILIFLDTMMMLNNENRKRRDERRSIVRLNRIVQPAIDMYIVRKNMVITPAEKTVRKFQIMSDFTVKDMKDMFSQSELVSDVGKSKIEMYAFYQNKLQDCMTHLVESVDFSFYQELCDAAMRYINATTYGASALEAVLSYQTSVSGMKSMRSVVIAAIRDEPDNTAFNESVPVMKNIRLVHQMIRDQESALKEYLGIIRDILAEEPKEQKPRQEEE